MPGSAKNDPLLLRVYLRRRSEAGVSNRSLARFLSALSGFQKHLAAHGTKDLIFKLPKMKYRAKMPAFIPRRKQGALGGAGAGGRYRNLCLSP